MPRTLRKYMWLYRCQRCGVRFFVRNTGKEPPSERPCKWPCMGTQQRKRRIEIE